MTASSKSVPGYYLLIILLYDYTHVVCLNSGSRPACGSFNELVRLAQKYISESLIYKFVNTLKEEIELR
jgi:hypothetical protein